MGKKKKHLRNKSKVGSVSSDGGSQINSMQKKNSVSVEKSDMALMMEGGAQERKDFKTACVTPLGFIHSPQLIQYHINK